MFKTLISIFTSIRKSTARSFDTNKKPFETQHYHQLLTQRYYRI
ncbi:hypothetical protein [Alteribacter lacisalsi]|nr:hypothetical protein [Alteribacter lacisalsi]